MRITRTVVIADLFAVPIAALSAPRRFAAGLLPGRGSVKRIVVVALVALATLAVAAASANAASPIHWWKADGNANDSVGTNNGTLENGATFAPGESGQAFSLDGASQYVSVPDDPSHYFSGSFTLDAWENTTASTGSHVILSIYECGNFCPASVANSAAQLWVVDGQAYGFVRDSTGMGPDGGGQQLQGGPNVADGAWHHLLFIRDVEAGKLALYVDG